MIHTSFFGYRNDKSCTHKKKKIYRRKGRLSKKKSTDEGGLQQSLKSENKFTPKLPTIHS